MKEAKGELIKNKTLPQPTNCNRRVFQKCYLLDSLIRNWGKELHKRTVSIAVLFLLLTNAFQFTHPSARDARWTSIADENEDYKIDLRDVGLIAKHFGDHYP
jgi:hypothetical protein